jgi:hypothetical protein
MKKGAVLKICQVIDVNDNTDGQRIKVRLSPEDDRKSDDQIPFAFPLLPKLVHIKPKVGELVLVILTEVNNGYSNRYYIGPIISQPQFMYKDDFLINAMSLYPGAFKEPDVAPSTNAESHGSLAGDDDIAIYGRNKSDIILTDDDVRIRCGSRLKNSTEKGGLSFNRLDPAFIHLKHSDTKRGNDEDKYRSTATIVADKINLIGNLSNEPFRTTDKKHMIDDNEMQKIIDRAHELPYGDILIDFLKLFVNAFANHVHPYPGLPPCQTSDYINTISYDLNKILSDSVRIN